MAKPLNRKASEVLLGSVIIARATSFLFLKLLLENMGQFTLLGIRSMIAFAVLVVIGFKTLKKTDKNDLFYGFLVGASFFVVMFLELTGLKYTTSVSIAFEENTAIIIVPIILAIMTKKFPDKKTILMFFMCGIGIVLLNFKPEGFEFNFGDLLGMMTALTYAGTIILTSKVADKADPIRVGIYQVGTMGILSLIAAFIFETPALPATGIEWTYMLYLAIICSVFGFTLQPYAQSGTTAERASVLCALNPITVAVLGALFLGETLTVKGIIGAVLIIASIVV